MNFGIVLDPCYIPLGYVVLMYVVAILGVRKWAASDDFYNDDDDRFVAFVIVIFAPISVPVMTLILAFKFAYKKLTRIILFGVKGNK